MADQNQLKLLQQGAKAWNNWRKDNRKVEIDLREALLTDLNLYQVNLSEANLNGAFLMRSSFRGANLNGADFRKTDFSRADFSEADLSEANLSEADLSITKFNGANLSGANLNRAYLGSTEFNGTNLRKANFSGAIMLKTILSTVDLSDAIDLASVNHMAESTLGTDTLSLSKGKLPEIFLRGCGLSDWEIEAAKLYNPNLTNQDMDEILYRVHDIRAHQPVQVSRLFVSYSHADSDFVDRLEKSLDEKGIRFWRDTHHATAGKLEKQIDRAIRHNPTVLVILSKNPIESDWVEHEVRLARKLEKETKRDVLCPVALDSSWKTSPWSESIMEQVMKYNILDFSAWSDDEKFEKMFVRLIDGLNLYYKEKEDE